MRRRASNQPRSSLEGVLQDAGANSRPASQVVVAQTRQIVSPACNRGATWRSSSSPACGWHSPSSRRPQRHSREASMLAPGVSDLLIHVIQLPL
uniref:Uncharacterized protein n=1 Tax=Zea mays TaxID=4577 RepID=B8A267_MAIZE|nr:unknown [Zea mays]ACN37089.1 unknown [Zea mays]|eukprot:NP_001146550.1 uncharacterized protein LOC100280146 [Zea mays]